MAIHALYLTTSRFALLFYANGKSFTAHDIKKEREGSVGRMNNQIALSFVPRNQF